AGGLRVGPAGAVIGPTSARVGRLVEDVGGLELVVDRALDAAGVAVGVDGLAEGLAATLVEDGAVVAGQQDWAGSKAGVEVHGGGGPPERGVLGAERRAAGAARGEAERADDQRANQRGSNERAQRAEAAAPRTGEAHAEDGEQPEQQDDDGADDPAGGQRAGAGDSHLLVVEMQSDL